MQMNSKMDLHCHSIYSDGTDTPREVVRLAAEAGVSLFALTDHDTMVGVPEAVREGKALGVLVLPSIEMDTESPFELHILGLDVDIENSALKSALLMAESRRNERNARILKILKDERIDVYEYFEESLGSTTRLNIARALVSAGYSKTISEAFRDFLGHGTIGFFELERPSPAHVIGLIRDAGGIPVLAHPCKLKVNPHTLIEQLAKQGLMGLEAFYPTSTKGQTELFVSLASEYGLLVTSGSDYHGTNREGCMPGSAWQNNACLSKSYRYFINHHSAKCVKELYNVK